MKRSVLLMWGVAGCGAPNGTAVDGATSSPSTDSGSPHRLDDSGRPPDTGDSSPPPDTGDSGAVVPFELWHEVGLLDDHVLALDTNLPSALADCRALEEVGAPCTDVDSDGLVDAWENLLLESFRPVVRLDEDEPFLREPDGVLVQLGRVVSESELTLFVPIVLAWSRDYGRCGVSAHHGDSERVVLQVTRTSSTGAAITAVYTAAHEGEVTDQGYLWTTDDLADLLLVTDEDGLHWVVFASEGKHASYGTAAACESASALPCIEEDCAPDGVSDLEDYDRLPVIANMGEPDHPAYTDLAELGLPGEDPWTDQRFCGGLDRDDPCSSALVEKLTRSPF